MSDEYYEAFERFCIVAESEGDTEAYEVVKKFHGIKIATEIYQKYHKEGDR